MTEKTMEERLIGKVIEAGDPDGGTFYFRLQIGTAVLASNANQFILNGHHLMTLKEARELLEDKESTPS